MSIEAKNILVINFGQIGDVIFSLPAMAAIRDKFADANITALVGKTSKAIVEMSGLTDEIMPVDRYALRDSNKLWSLAQIFKLVADVRRRRFDFVIDLHSFTETNLLGFLSGVKLRLYANRGNRSLDFLSNFRPKPPIQDRKIHKTDDYLRNLIPLGILDAPRIPKLSPFKEDVELVSGVFRADGIHKNRLIGMSPGAGHPSRKWALSNFARLAELLSADPEIRILVFLGHEEHLMREETSKIFPPQTLIYDDFDLRKLAAACSFLDLFICNDTGPIHLASAVGTPTMLTAGFGGSDRYRPHGPNAHSVGNKPLEELEPEEVFEAIRDSGMAG